MVIFWHLTSFYTGFQKINAEKIKTNLEFFKKYFKNLLLGKIGKTFQIKQAKQNQ